jgi:hypothetical protein
MYSSAGMSQLSSTITFGEESHRVASALFQNQKVEGAPRAYGFTDRSAGASASRTMDPHRLCRISSVTTVLHTEKGPASRTSRLCT